MPTWQPELNAWLYPHSSGVLCSQQRRVLVGRARPQQRLRPQLDRQLAAQQQRRRAGLRAAIIGTSVRQQRRQPGLSARKSGVRSGDVH